MAAASSPIRYAIVGAGAFGANHLRVLQQLQHPNTLQRQGGLQGAPQRDLQSAPHGPEVELAAVVESDAGRRQQLKTDHPALPVFATVDECLAATAAAPLHAASVCVPTSAHRAVAEPLLRAGLDLLIEKPLAASLADADALLTLARQHGRLLQVGHLERFNPAILAVEPFLHVPMFFEAHRLSVFTPRSLDVDVVLDLMIHDLDIVLSLVASPVQSVHAVGLPVLSGKVDIANVRVEFASGCVANFTASRVSTERVRKLRFFQPHQYVSIDYARQDLLLISVPSPGQQKASAPAVDPGGPAHPSGLAVQHPQVTAGEPLRLEIESFLECVRTRRAPRVTGEEGRAALALALDINQAIAEHHTRAGLDRFV